MNTALFFTGVKQGGVGCDVNLSPPYNAEVKKEWSYISILPRFSGPDKDNSTF